MPATLPIRPPARPAPAPVPPTMPSGNHWSDPRCAKAFWSQCDLPIFKRLVDDTVALADPRAGEEWLDLGCGGGALTRAIWARTDGQVASVTGVDAADANDARYRAMDHEFGSYGRVRFRCADFSRGLGLFADGEFDHAVSGLSMSYAESFDAATGKWDRAAYDQLMRELFRVIRPGGHLVFSVNVPDPSWLTVGLRSLAGGLAGARKRLKFLKNSARMLRYGAWLKREARAGRFHYLPAEVTAASLEAAGFTGVTHRLAYANQAFLFRAEKRA